MAAEIPLEGDGSVAAAIDLCYDHSPEALAEFRRVRAFRPSTSRPGFSEVNFVYDSLSFNKAACPDIFAITGTPLSAEENLTVTNTGKYYKNVRSEWASLVCTPSHAAHQDALAFTRSLGDFHLQTYGVSHAPEVRPPIDLAQACGGPAVLIVATDGIWDNWKLQDCIGELLKPEVRVPFLPSLLRVSARATNLWDELWDAPSPVAHAFRIRQLVPQFVLHLSFSLLPEQYLAAVATAEGDIDVVAQAFMRTNLTRAHANFGSSCDNMALTVCYLNRGDAAASGGGGASGP